MKDNELKAIAQPLDNVTRRFGAELIPLPWCGSILKDVVFIFGWNTDNDTTPLFYGRELLKSIIANGNEVKAAVAVFRYSGFTDELEVLAAVCEIAKGKCDYEGDDDFYDDLCDRLFSP